MKLSEILAASKANGKVGFMLSLAHCDDAQLVSEINQALKEGTLQETSKLDGFPSYFEVVN